MPPVKKAAPGISPLSVIVALVVASATGTAVFFLSSGDWSFRSSQTVTVVGKGQKTVGEDLVELHFSMAVEGFSSAKEAMEELKKKDRFVGTALAATGVAQADIRVDNTQVIRQQRNSALLNASEQLHVLVRNPKQIDAITAAVQTQGATVLGEPIESQPTFAHARIRAREDAEADARERAGFLAEKQGKVLGKLIQSSAEENVESLAVSSAARRNKEREVTIHVTATYEIE